jgi:Tol biopolymer transport system component
MTGRSFNRLFAAAALMICAICGGFFAARAETRSNSINASPQAAASATPAPPPVTNGGLPVAAPDVRHIAYVSDRSGADDVFVIAADGSGELQLTHTPEGEGNLQWSADGKQIIFSRFANGTSHIFAIDLAGRNEHAIGTVPGRGPTLGVDGKRLVYMAGSWTETLLMVSALDGSNPRQINDGRSIAWNNRWSPDDKQIAFTGRNEPKGELAVFVMNADGSGRRQVTHIPAAEGGAQWPGWSPDGSQLVVQVNSRTIKNSAHVWIVNVATGEARKLAAHDQAYLDETPSWFVDGKRITFQSNRTGKMEVWVMNADGTGASNHWCAPLRK